MGLRFFKRIKVLPGLTINFTKRGISASLGVRGAKITAGTSGTRATVGLPGTGLFYTKKLKHWSEPPSGKPDPPGIEHPLTPPRVSKPTSETAHASSSISNPLVDPDLEDMSAFTAEYFSFNPDELAFVDSLYALSAGDAQSAAVFASRAAETLRDGAALAGVLAMSAKEYPLAVTYFESATTGSLLASGGFSSPGELFRKYELYSILKVELAGIAYPVTFADSDGVSTALALACYLAGDPVRSVGLLREFVEGGCGDAQVRLVLSWMLMATSANDPATCQEVIAISEGYTEESLEGPGLLLCRGIALASLGLFEAARTVFSDALHRQPQGSPQFVHELLYRRGVAYESLGQPAKARRDFEDVYAADSDFADTATRLGLSADARPAPLLAGADSLYAGFGPAMAPSSELRVMVDFEDFERRIHGPRGHNVELPDRSGEADYGA